MKDIHIISHLIESYTILDLFHWGAYTRTTPPCRLYLSSPTILRSVHVGGCDVLNNGVGIGLVGEHVEALIRAVVVAQPRLEDPEAAQGGFVPCSAFRSDVQARSCISAKRPSRRIITIPVFTLRVSRKPQVAIAALEARRLKLTRARDEPPLILSIIRPVPRLIAALERRSAPIPVRRGEAVVSVRGEVDPPAGARVRRVQIEQLEADAGVRVGDTVCSACQRRPASPRVPGKT